MAAAQACYSSRSLPHSSGKDPAPHRQPRAHPPADIAQQEAPTPDELHHIDVTLYDFIDRWNTTEQFGEWHPYPFDQVETLADDGDVKVIDSRLTNRFDVRMSVDNDSDQMRDVLLVYGPFADIRDVIEAFVFALEVVRPNTSDDARWDAIADLLPNDEQGQGHMDAGYGETILFDDLIIAMSFDQSIIPDRSYSNALHLLIAPESDPEYAQHLE